MAPFAEGTEVPVAKTRGEIEALLERHGAENFGTGWVRDLRAGITFGMHGRLIRFELPLPGPDEAKKALRQRRGNYTNRAPTQGEIEAWLAGENRRRWRSLLLGIKAKLENAASGIFTFEEEFLAHIVTKDNLTIYESLKLAEGPQRLLPALG